MAEPTGNKWGDNQNGINFDATAKNLLPKPASILMPWIGFGSKMAPPNHIKKKTGSKMAPFRSRESDTRMKMAPDRSQKLNIFEKSA